MFTNVSQNVTLSSFNIFMTGNFLWSVLVKLSTDDLDSVKLSPGDIDLELLGN